MLTAVVFGLAAACCASAADSEERTAFADAATLYELATHTGGDLLLFRPAALDVPGASGLLLSFAPLHSGDELRVPVAVSATDTYELHLHNLRSPHFHAYSLRVDGQLLPLPVGLRWAQGTMRRNRYGLVRLAPGPHVLGFRFAADAAMHPLVIESLWLEPGRAHSLYALEAEQLPVPGRAESVRRPRLGCRELSAFNELVLCLHAPEQTFELELPPPPAASTHLIAALVGAPTGADARLRLGAGPVSRSVSTRLPYPNQRAIDARVVAVVTVPVSGTDSAGAPQRLSVHTRAPDAAVPESTLGIDGVAYAEAYTFEAEWLLWQGPWAPGVAMLPTGSGRATDRGYIAATCRDTDGALTCALDLPWTGAFTVEVRVATYPDQGTFDVYLDEHALATALNLNADRGNWPEQWLVSRRAEIAAGVHTLAFRRSDRESDRNRLRIDAIRLRPTR